MATASWRRGRILMVPNSLPKAQQPSSLWGRRGYRQCSPSTSQHHGHLILRIVTERETRSLRPLSPIVSTSSRQPSGSRGGTEQEENNLGSVTMPERDGKHNRAIFKVLGINEGRAKVTPVSSTTWTCALRIIVKPKDLAFSWTP